MQHTPSGDKMLESNTVRKIGFTGSTRIGKQLMAAQRPLSNASPWSKFLWDWLSPCGTG